ncbi:MAG: gfo/Idh/MocA family oxidoreductase [Chloroflexi bacterium]|nr:MAG: gfo/Idh/MocA family oxidoreductase [Chloroflexota bacterium]
MNENRLRTGILGCGSFAPEHARVLLELNDQVELSAFCDRHEDRAAALSQQFTSGTASVYTSPQELIMDAGLDVLISTLPPYGHSGEVEMAAQRGIHLLIEKPISLSSEAAWRMVAAVEESGVKSQVGYKFRFGTAVEALKRMIETGQAGRPGLFSARYFANALHSPWWRVREKSGGQLFEQGTHLLDLARYFLGEAEAVYSRQENLFHQNISDYTIEDVSATVISFKNGSIGVIYVTNGAIPNRWINDYRFVAQSLTAEFTDSNNATFYLTADPSRAPQIISSERDVLKEQMLDLIDAIRTGKETRTPIREGALSLDLALGAFQSSQVRSEVRLA